MSYKSVSQVSLRSVSGAYFVRQTEPKILRLVSRLAQAYTIHMDQNKGLTPVLYCKILRVMLPNVDCIVVNTEESLSASSTLKKSSINGGKG